MVEDRPHLHQPPSPPPSSTNLLLEHPLPFHAHVHDVLHPGPERVLSHHRDAVDHVTPPAFHDLRVLSPEAHALARDLALPQLGDGDRKSTRLNSSHLVISYAVFC